MPSADLRPQPSRPLEPIMNRPALPSTDSISTFSISSQLTDADPIDNTTNTTRLLLDTPRSTVATSERLSYVTLSPDANSASQSRLTSHPERLQQTTVSAIDSDIVETIPYRTRMGAHCRRDRRNLRVQILSKAFRAKVVVAHAGILASRGTSSSLSTAENEGIGDDVNEDEDGYDAVEDFEDDEVDMTEYVVVDYKE
ncbi:hypothetical protein BGZ99_004705 [Dissophora globulifera]|uniref:Uncharacterized protein n=1 Tax=Dissophora globulifera TaxID=979702 RepID=A0A9P6RJH5_9FUNG|nr:hypothetical protein BGZ99_004705 [Dissophora globulifera]